MLYSLANDGKLSGRADGNVYMRNGRIRAFKVPALVQNSFTAVVRSRFSTNSSDWNSLNDDERASWNNASGYTTTDRFGRTIQLKGKQLFVSLNNNLAAVGVATLAECPTPELIDGIVTLTAADFDQSASTCALAYTATPTATNTRHLVFATAPQSAGTARPSASKYRVIDLIAGTSASPFAAGAPYVAKFGTPAIGTKIFFKVLPINTDTGQAGIPLIVSTTVVA